MLSTREEARSTGETVFERNFRSLFLYQLLATAVVSALWGWYAGEIAVFSALAGGVAIAIPARVSYLLAAVIDAPVADVGLLLGKFLLTVVALGLAAYFLRDNLIPLMTCAGLALVMQVAGGALVSLRAQNPSSSKALDR